jgi:hypothetical protein
MLLAYSQRPDVVPALEDQLAWAEEETRADILAAIDAIRCQNHNYFVDREHSGQITLNIA